MTYFIEGATTDGFAFVVQNSRTTNTLSSGGHALGFSGGVGNYMAVGLDLCQDRADTTCNKKTLRVETRKNGEEPRVIGAELDVSSIDFTGTKQYTVRYLDDLEQVVVVIDGSRRVFELNESLVEIIGGDNTERFAFYGFTASNSQLAGTAAFQPANIKVNKLEIVQMNSETRLDTEGTEPNQVVEFGKNVLFTMVLTDSCNNKLRADIPPFEETKAKLTAKLSAQGSNRVLTTEPEADNDDNATIFLTFAMPLGVIEKWDLEVTYDSVQMQGSPLQNAVSTEQDEVSKLKPLGIGLLAALIAVLVIGVILIVHRLNKYREKLKTNEENIQYGKTKAVIDGIDKNIDYNINPMIAPLDKLKERLANNEKVIKQLKDGQKDAVDSDYTVEQLQAENAELRREMNDLKKKQEFGDAGLRISTSIGKRLLNPGQQERNDFEQERAE